MNGTYRTLGPHGLALYQFDGPKLSFSEKEGEANVLVPGWVDLHVHGGFGIDFMGATSAEILEWADRLWEMGVEVFLPTTVTCSVEDALSAIGRLPEHRAIGGFHLEGPFLSPKYPGAQPPSFIIDPPAGPSSWDAVLDDPRLRIITLAPERPGALQLTRRLASQGVKVSMGHTNATYAQAKEGYEAGARHTTHTYNAMRPLHHREAGTVGFALSEDDLFCELIYDRHHVCPEAAAILLRSKPADRVIAVSDGTLASGLVHEGPVLMWNLEAILADGQVRLADGTLAGSAITIRDAFQNLWADFGLETAIRACSLNPRKAIGWDGPPRVWVEYSPDGTFVRVHLP